jgi:hypothetical protein
MESLEGLWEKFSLSEHESQKVDLVSTTTQPKSFLSAKFLTRRALNVESVGRTLKSLWRTDHGFTIRDMNNNKLVFVFEDEADRERVMLGEPWAYDNYLIILQRIEEDEAIEEVEFTETSFWVQLHGIPVRRMNHKVAKILGSSLGKIAHVTEGDKAADGGQAMHVRVSLNINKPLCRGRTAKLEKGREVWISFKYERLPNFCYWCGLVTHSDKDCPHWLRNQETLQIEDQQFGSWLRASNERSWRKMEIKIEGIIKPPPPTKAKTPPSPSTNPITTQTQSNSPTPIIIPPSPSSHTSPTRHFTISSPPEKTSPHPPQTATPADHHQPNHDNHPTHMDLEENPGFAPIFSYVIRQEQNFGSQLRDIDNALNYFSPSMERLSKPLTSSKSSLSPTQQNPCAVLGDITNKDLTHLRGQKSNPRKKSWKKLARAQSISEDRPLDPVHIKRPSTLLEDNDPGFLFSKK